MSKVCLKGRQVEPNLISRTKMGSPEQTQRREDKAKWQSEQEGGPAGQCCARFQHAVRSEERATCEAKEPSQIGEGIRAMLHYKTRACTCRRQWLTEKETTDLSTSYECAQPNSGSAERYKAPSQPGGPYHLRAMAHWWVNGPPTFVL